MADVWISGFSTAPPTPQISTLGGDDTFRGGGDFTAFTVSALLDASRDRTLLGAVLPAGWTPATVNAGSVAPVTLGVVTDSGVTPGGEGALESPDSDYTYFDTAVDVTPILPVDSASGDVDGAILEVVIPGGFSARIGVRRSPTGNLIYGEVVSNGVIVEAGVSAIPAASGRFTLRLVRNGSRVYGLTGIRDVLTRTYSVETKVFEGVLGTTAGGVIRLASRNNSTARVARARFSNYTVEAHAVINNRLIDRKFITTSRQVRGFVPRATLAEVGLADVEVFGLFGVASAPGGFTYTLPPPKTIGNEVTRILRTYEDRQIRDS